MKKLKVPTKRGVLLDGVLFGGGSDTVMIAIKGIHQAACKDIRKRAEYRRSADQYA